MKIGKRNLETYIKGLIETGELWRFYKSEEWLRLREEVLKDNHYECAKCRERGKVTTAETVHHVQYVKRHPSLALSRTYTYEGKTYTNLLPLCHECHDEVHGRMKFKKQKEFNEERW